MKNITRHTGKLTNIKRLPSSVNGNPRYSFYIAGVNARTAVDSPHGYSLTNYENKIVTVTVGTHYGHTTLNSIEKTDAQKAFDISNRRCLLSNRERHVMENYSHMKQADCPKEFEAVTVYGGGTSFMIITAAGNHHRIGDIVN